MSDLIDRKMAVQGVKELFSLGNCYCDELSIVGMLNVLPSVEPERKWIPVTEALPINDVDVIVSVLDNSGDTPYRFTSVGWCTPNGQYWVVDNEMCYGVIAWMPLPEPYRGDR